MKTRLVILGHWMILGFWWPCLELSAQTWDELFKQKETQKEYLLLQVGALRIQSGLLKEAGEIASLGLTSISAWRNWERELHADFFASFSHLGPLAQAALERMEDSGLTPQVLLGRIRTSESFWNRQSGDVLFLRWSERVHQGMQDRCNGFLADLELMRNNGLQVKDAERAGLIDQLAEHILVLSQDLSRFQEVARFRTMHHRFRENELQLLNRF
ncbi:hypothetical protein [Algoriphagus confluentis]